MISACATMLLLGGCAGYQLGPSNGESAGAHSVQVMPVVNKTLEPRLGDSLMNALRKNIQRDGTYRLNTSGEGDIILTTTITKYQRSDLSYQPTDVVTVQDYQIMMTAHVVAKQRGTGKIVLDKDVIGQTLLQAGNDLPSAELQAFPVMSDDLARRATAMLTDGTW